MLHNYSFNVLINTLQCTIYNVQGTLYFAHHGTISQRLWNGCIHKHAKQRVKKDSLSTLMTCSTLIGREVCDNNESVRVVTNNNIVHLMVPTLRDFIATKSRRISSPSSSRVMNCPLSTLSKYKVNNFCRSNEKS